MLWLIITVFAYFILAIVCLADKYLLKEGIPNPKVFAFYVGILGVLALFIIPFAGFYVPGGGQVVISLLAGALSIYALFWFYKDLSLFEASRVVPTIGGLIPLFTFGLVYLFSLGKEVLSLREGIAFILLVCGSVIITLPSRIFAKRRHGKTKEEKPLNPKRFSLPVLTAFLFSLSFVLTKYIYLEQTFWNGFIWRSIGGFLMAIIFFIFFPEIKKEIFKKKIKIKKKTVVIFLSNQTLSAGATILQNWAIALAPLAYVAIINALQGVQYVFLFVFAIFLSLKFPEILKEEISKRIIFQKVFAILSLCLGLAILVLK